MGIAYQTAFLLEVPSEDLVQWGGPPRPPDQAPTTIHCPQTVSGQVVETKMVCVPRTVCKQVPVTVHCPSPVVPSSPMVEPGPRAIAGSPQAVTK